MPYHKRGAYDCFDHIDEVAEKYKRCRKRKSLILSDEAVNASKVICAECGKQIFATNDPRNDQPGGGRSNRANYYPKHKVLVVKHYYCSWESLMNAIIVHNGVMQGVKYPQAVISFE